MRRLPVTRPCFLGNSHLACLKLAADRDPSLVPDGTAWFAGSSTSLAGMRLRGSRLVPRGQRLKAQMTAVSGGTEQIDLEAHDLFVIIGVGFEYRSVFSLLRTYCLFSDMVRGRQADRLLISDGFFRGLLGEIHAKYPGERIARQIRSVNPDARVLILPAPYPSETILDRPDLIGGLAQIRNSDCFAEMVAFHLEGARRAAEAAGAQIVPQDPATIAATGFTQARYNERAVGLQGARLANAKNWHDEKRRYDPWHMNVDFGQRQLLALAAALQTAVVPEPMLLG